jgi:hypothetical protein
MLYRVTLEFKYGTEAWIVESVSNVLALHAALMQSYYEDLDDKSTVSSTGLDRYRQRYVVGQEVKKLDTSKPVLFAEWSY